MHIRLRIPFFGLMIWVLAGTLALGQGVAPICSSLRQKESEHFRYVYQESLEDRVPHLAKCCEDAHTLLTEILKWTPRRKTTVFYCDNEDMHNGWATVYPRRTIMILASDAPPGSSIYEPGDYIRRTVFHEYTHVLSMDSQYGVDAFLSKVFGRWYPISGDIISVLLMIMSASPGTLAPTWFQEGLAIWSETELVGPGRGRSSFVDMIIRMAVVDSRVLSSRKWSLEHPEWPYGTAAYLYGMKTIEHIHDTYSFGPEAKNAVGEVSDWVSHSFWYNINMRSRPVTKRTFGQLAADSMKAEMQRQFARIAKLKIAPVTEVTRMTPQRLMATNPKFGPNGKKIYFSGGEESGRDSLRVMETASKSIRRIRSARTTYSTYTDLATDKDRNTVYYTRLNIHGKDRVRNELRRIDTRRHNSRLVARQGRYRYPAVSFDGTAMAAVVNRAGLQSLVEFPIDMAGDKAHEKVLVEAGYSRTLVHPVYSPDGKWIVYVLADETGSTITRMNLDSGEKENLLSWPCIIINPAFHPTGREIVFCSDRNGVYNLYRIPFVSRPVATALTHVLGGIFEPDFSPDGQQLAASAYDSYGRYLVMFNYADLKPLGLNMPAIEADWKSLPDNMAKKQQVENRPVPDLGESRKYISLGGIRLDGWAPWFGVTESAVAGGVAASFSDPTQFNVLQIIGGVDGETESAVGSVVYQYSGFYPELILYGGASPQGYEYFVVDTNNTYYDYGEDINYVGAALSIPWPRVDRQWALTLGYQFSDRAVIT
ncbi:MAG: PD40 domain-containing protein, partial [Lentisphaerae bacterium]|nr:PD40 domain-containing protein [Lentisphaerota bacterium]